MPFLNENDRRAVRSRLSGLASQVVLRVFTQEFECQYCRDLRELSSELEELADGKIKMELYDFEKDKQLADKWRVDKIPALLLHGEREYGIRYFGLPAGYEFAALLEDLHDVSRGRSRLSPSTVEKVRKINSPVHIQVFVTPTCPYCPRAVRTAHQMALENNLITADMVEAIEFPHLANKYDVMAVPKIVVNDKVMFEGALPEAHFLEHVLMGI
ncbi:MAG: thioredoxin family protein [Candidatus Caldarchaeum sp.]|nr:thioredoxin family protein [Candidatus Caldarchaeum sp.]MCS7137786.1 thioredoxin family protein [Candidatus Caldarchaeum sp.]MDW8359835.1 thioredoxin family protein [Candidatus Caldarchaeum sp.]